MVSQENWYLNNGSKGFRYYSSFFLEKHNSKHPQILVIGKTLDFELDVCMFITAKTAPKP